MKNANTLSVSQPKMPHVVKDQVTKTVTFSALSATIKSGERGFSLIELLLVVVVIGVIATLAIPNAQRAIRAGENGNTYSTMRTISSTEIGYFSQSGRWARLTEVNNMLSSSIGTQSGNDVIHGKFTFSMSPAAPTDAELKDGYTITATRNVVNEDTIFIYEINQNGFIRQVSP